MTCVEPQRMRMTRSFSHYTDGARFYLSRKLKIFWEDQKIAAFGSSYRDHGSSYNIFNFLLR